MATKCSASEILTNVDCVDHLEHKNISEFLLGTVWVSLGTQKLLFQKTGQEERGEKLLKIKI